MGLALGYGLGLRNQLAFGGKKSLLSLTRNSDFVPVNSILPISQDTTYLSARSGIGDHVFTSNKTDRIRQSGDITKIALASVKTLTNITRCNVYFWRKVGSNYNKIGSVSLYAKISVGLNIVTLDTPIPVLEGDHYSYDLGASTPNTDFISATATTNGSLYTITDIPTDTAYPWNSKTAFAYVARSIFSMQAPLIVTIGDSVMESYPLHTSFVDSTWSTVAITKSWQSKLAAKDSRIVYQNLGFGGQNSTQVLARFDAQVIAAKPRIAVINSGLNDLGQSVTKATFIANVTSMLNKCSSAGIIPILWEIPPCNNLTNTQMQYRDDWNASIRTLMLSYSTGKIVNFDDMGVNRVGGDADNLWDINPTYAYGDGTHYNEVGNQFIADKMYLILK